MRHKDTTLKYLVKKGDVFAPPTDLELGTDESILDFYTAKDYTQAYDF